MSQEFNSPHLPATELVAELEEDRLRLSGYGDIEAFTTAYQNFWG